MGKENLLEFGKDLGVLDYESSIKIDDLNSLRNQVVWLCLIRNSVLFVFGRLVIVDFSNSSGIQWTSFSHLPVNKLMGIPSIIEAELELEFYSNIVMVGRA